MNTYLILLKQALYEERVNGRTWQSLIVAFLAIIVTLLIGFKSHDWSFAFFAGIGGSILMLILAWWISFMRITFRQNTPVNAHLVPKLRGRLIATTFAVWLFVSTGITLLALIGVKQGIQVGIVASLCLLYLASIWRVPLGIFFVVAMCTLLSKQGQMPAFLSAENPDSKVLIASVIFLLLFAAIFFQWLFKKGGDAHWNFQIKANRVGQKNLASSAIPDKGILWKFISSVTKIAQFGYFRSLKKNADGKTPSGSLTCYGLGPNFHWYQGVSMEFSGLFFLVLFISALILFHETKENLRNTLSPMAIMFLGFPLQYVARHLNAVYRTNKEQALLRLAPNIPQGAALNRTIAKMSLRYFAIVWLASVAISFCLVQFSSKFMVNICLAAASLQLLWAGVLMRDYARTKESPEWHQVLHLMLLFFSVCAWLVLQTFIAIPVQVLFVLCAIGAVFLIQYRWKKMRAAPAAYPASRLANQ